MREAIPSDMRCPGAGYHCFSCSLPDCILRACNPTTEEAEITSAARPCRKRTSQTSDRTALSGVRGQRISWKWNPDAYQEKMKVSRKPRQEIEAELQKEYGEKLHPVSCPMEKRQTCRLDVVEVYFRSRKPDASDF